MALLLKPLKLLKLLKLLALLSLCRDLELPPPQKELPVVFFLGLEASLEVAVLAAGSCSLSAAAVEAGGGNWLPFCSGRPIATLMAAMARAAASRAESGDMNASSTGADFDRIRDGSATSGGDEWWWWWWWW